MRKKSQHLFTIEHLLLGLLQQQPMHGYEIYQRLKAHQVLGMIWSVKQSQLYAILGRLEDAGYLNSTTETQDAYPPRKVLHLTSKGESAFAKWVSNPTPDWESAQDEFLAKFFFAQRTGDETARILVDRQQEVGRGWQRTLTDQLHALKPYQSSEWLVLQLRLRQIEAFLDWLEGCTIHFTSPLVVHHVIAPLAASAQPELAHQFVAYVTSSAGQTILERYGFLPASTVAHSPHTPAAESFPWASSSSPDPSLCVFAASTLNNAFTAIAEAFSTLYGGIPISLTFAGSQHLAEEIIRGTAADVFASASIIPMQAVIQTGLVREGSEQICARNRLIAVTSKTNPVSLTTLSDLAQPGLKIAFGSHATAIGQYTMTLLEHACQEGALDVQEQKAVLQNVTFYGQDIQSVLAMVQEGTADVAIVYTSDYPRSTESAYAKILPIDALWKNTREEKS